MIWERGVRIEGTWVANRAPVGCSPHSIGAGRVAPRHFGRRCAVLPGALVNEVAQSASRVQLA